MQNETRYGFFVTTCAPSGGRSRVLLYCCYEKNRCNPPVADIAPSAAHAAPRKKRFLRKALSAAAALYLFADLFGKAQFVTCRYESKMQEFIRRAHRHRERPARRALWRGTKRNRGHAGDAKPHAVLLLGDFFDQHGNNENTVTLLHALAADSNVISSSAITSINPAKTVSIRAAIEAAASRFSTERPP
jgi:hypothetical protein